MPNLIRSVRHGLVGLDKPAAVEAPTEPLKPAVAIKTSITDDHIISLEDGRKFKSAKRHLASLGMTSADDRAEWGLPSDDPTVAPSYAAKRSEFARSSRLGRNAVEAASTAEDVTGAAARAQQPGRPKKAA